jgi:hypothetical protein
MKDVSGALDIVSQYSECGASAVALQKALKDADDHGRPVPTHEQLIAIVREASARNVYGHDAKKDRNGEWIEQGVGSRGRESINHFNAIRRYEGKEAYDDAVREMWKRDPDRAKKIGLPKITEAPA